MNGFQYNPPPSWPQAPPGWQPPDGWRPPPEWPPAPPGWQFWTLAEREEAVEVADIGAEAPGQSTVDQAAADPDPAEELLDLPGPLDHGATDEVDRPSAAVVAETGNVEPDDEVARLRRELAEAHAALKMEREYHLETAALVDVGVYQYRHPLDSADEYREALNELKLGIRECITGGRAIAAVDRFVYNNSLGQGRRMVDDLSKLMLRAYNAEADNCVRTVRAGSVTAAVRRLERAVTSIERLGRSMDMRITPEYHALRVREIELTGDFLVKRQEEREAERERREQLREQRRAEAELAAEREKLAKERSHYETVLTQLRERGYAEDAEEMAQRLAAIDEAIERNDYRAANIRAGYVYVISNVGAFGPDVVKIGMTRRLDPMDRVRELGDASVPFPFDVHLIHFSDDAIGMEAALHQAFAEERLNQVNLRREFFRATPRQVRNILVDRFGTVLEFTAEPEALQYQQSLSVRSVAG